MLLLHCTCAELSCIVANMSSSSCSVPASQWSLLKASMAEQASHHASVVTCISTSTKLGNLRAISISVVQNLQSKFSAGTTGTSQRLGAFGSLLGDKAAEVTAMAQQSLGDYVPTAFPSGLASSSLSGFTSGASGLFAGFKGLRGSNG